MQSLLELLRLRPRQPSVSVIRLQGAIGVGGARSLTDAGLDGPIEAAFRGRPAAVALQINSPGGSPVQSSLIAARIRRLAEEKRVPVVAFVEDVAASGGYWLATAADEIFCDHGSLLGSIGVVSQGFGFQDLIARLGVERRVHTAGRSKSMLDPFRPEKPEDVARLDSWLAQLHDVFVAQIRARRGARLSDHPDLFSGEIWIGERAVNVGLADGIGHLVPVMRGRFGDRVRFRAYARRRPFLSRFGLAFAQEAAGLLEERAAFARFGL